LERSASQYYSKIVFKMLSVYNVEDGTQDDILWDDSEQSGKSASSSENECSSEGSLHNFLIK
jgi:hypothetical protein